MELDDRAFPPLPTSILVLTADADLKGVAVQYREIQSHESTRFLSHFSRFTVLAGGISSGFRTVVDLPEPDVLRLYRVSLVKVSDRGSSNLVVREVKAEKESLVAGDVYVLDKGPKIWQLNTKASVGQEKFKAAEFVRWLSGKRGSSSEVVVYGEHDASTRM